MSEQFGSYGGFFTHTSREKGGNFLKSWRENPGFIDIWFHVKAPPAALWRHPFHKLEPREDKAKGIHRIEIWSNPLACYEPEVVLKKQFRIDKKTGERNFPPKVCPMCRLLEWLRLAIWNNQLDWRTPVFKFQGVDSRTGLPDVRTLHAGGMLGQFSAQDMSQEDKDELNSAGIFQKEAWKENVQAKLWYLFVVVAENDPARGVQIAIEKGSLGDAIKKIVEKRMEEFGVEKGDPAKHPICFRWKYDKSKPWNDQYDANTLSQVSLRPEIDQLIRSEPPNIRSLLSPFNAALERSRWEKHCVLPGIPWDEIFAGHDKTSASDPATSFDFGSNGAKETKKGEYECDACHASFDAPMNPCPKCGARYDDDGNLIAAATPQPPAGWNLSGSTDEDDDIPYKG
jgi:hypothetical protein